jgi:hypothetical protein
MSRTSIPSAPAHDPRRRDDGARERARFTVCGIIARDDSRRDQRGEDDERLGVVAKKAFALAPNAMSSTTMMMMMIITMSFAPLVDNTQAHTPLFSHAHRWWSSHSGRR